eukprot:881403_1
MSRSKAVLMWRLLDILLSQQNEVEKSTKLESLMSFVSSCSSHLDYFVHFLDWSASLVCDSAICDGDLCFDSLVYAMYLQHLMMAKPTMIKKKHKQNKRELEIARKKKRKRMDELCSKMLHLSSSSMQNKYLIGSVYIWYLDKYEDGGALFGEYIWSCL